MDDLPQKKSSNFHPIQPPGPVNRLGDGQFRWMSVAALRRVRGSQPKTRGCGVECSF